jgi:hypothetical protein
MQATQVEQQRRHMARAAVLVEEITGYDVEKQNRIMFETAFEWLEQLGMSEAEVNAHTNTKQFWGFWRTEWHRLDLMFINFFNFSIMGELGSQHWRDIYTDHHHPDGRYINHPVVRAGLKNLEL